jgi:hypothetical protein
MATSIPTLSLPGINNIYNIFSWLQKFALGSEGSYKEGSPV